MKLVKGLLLGSAAGLCAVNGVQAADLPMRKAAPIEYVRVCTAHGAGFFYIPGTETCIRVGGRARAEYQYTSNTTRAASLSGWRGFGRLNIDARTSTDYGLLRAFVRFDIASRTGGYLFSGNQIRLANAFPGTGVDTSNQVQKFVEIDKAFIQFAGFTAGRTQSFYDFYGHELEFLGSSVSPDANTNLFAYTATFGGGFSSTLSVEDRSFRRVPIYSNGATGGVNTAVYTGAGAGPGNFVIGGVPLASIGNAFNAAGVPTSVYPLDVQQRNVMPDIVANLRYDAAWGAAQISAAVHELHPGLFTSGAVPVNGGLASTAPANAPNSQYARGVLAGLKLNVPQLAPGDQLFLQGAYSQGSLAYSGVYSANGVDTQLTVNNGNANFTTLADLVYDARGRAHLTESYSGLVGFLHYWTPEIRQGAFASFALTNYDSILRTSLGPFSGALGTAGVTNANRFNPTLRSFSTTYVGSNLIWSPVRDLDVGVEVVYQKIDYRGVVADGTRGGTAAIAGSTVGGTGRTTLRMISSLAGSAFSATSSRCG